MPSSKLPSIRAEDQRMIKRNRRAAVVALALFVGAVLLSTSGCGNKNRRKDGSLVTDRGAIRGFLAPIPADTPYAFVAIEPMPIAPLIEWAEPFVSSVKGLMPASDSVLKDDYVGAESKFAYALFSEIMESYSVEGFKELGFSTTPRGAFYGIGFLPALRFDIDDRDKFEAFVARAEAKSGIERRTETIDQKEFWSYKLGGDHVVVAIQERVVIVGWTEADAADLFTRTLIGVDKSEPSMADDDTIQQISKKYDYKLFGTGFVDLRRVTQLLLEPQDSIHDQIQARIRPVTSSDTPPACVEETKRLTNAAPRIVFGYKGWSSTEIAFGGGLELTGELSEQLAAARAPAPLVGTEPAQRAPLVASFGFDVGKVLEVASNLLLQVQRQPFQCDWYRDLNQTADELLAGMAFVPAMVSNLKGAAVLLQDVSFQQGAAPAAPPTQPGNTPAPTPLPTGPSTKIEGAVVVASAAPGSLLSYLKTLAPEFESVSPTPNGPPVRLPPSEALTVFVDPHVVLTDSTLAFISGLALVEDGVRLAAPATNPTPFMGLSYDLQQWFQMMEMFGGPAGTMTSNMPLGRTEIALEPTGDGIFIDASMALKSTSSP